MADWIETKKVYTKQEEESLVAGIRKINEDYQRLLRFVRFISESEYDEPLGGPRMLATHLLREIGELD